IFVEFQRGSILLRSQVRAKRARVTKLLTGKMPWNFWEAKSHHRNVVGATPEPDACSRVFSKNVPMKTLFETTHSNTGDLLSMLERCSF
ncbi:MAG: hypothetical protein EBU93_03205, partial [Chlamydiae bacterium]|nr:hypothetical protein [Chlamydiota bacterium]